MRTFFRHVLQLALCGALSVLIATGPRAAEKSDLGLLRDRMVDAILLDAASRKDRDPAEARRALDALRPDGMWPDVDYEDRTPSGWKTQAHLDRTVTMARAFRRPGSPMRGDATLKAGIVSSLDAWLKRDLQNPNWWHNQISVPRMVGETLILLGEAAPSDTLRAAAPLLARSDWETMVGKRRVLWNGANLVDMAQNRIVRGLLQDDEAMVADALRRAWGEVRIVPPGEEGLQADLSFHQHGSLIYDGGYGEVFVRAMTRLLHLARDTRFSAPEAVRDLLVRYVLDAQQWMIRGNHWDYGVLGRGISRANRTAAGYATVLDALAEAAGPRAADVRAFAGRLRGGDKPPFTGNRHFWRSDFMVHHRLGWYASVRGYSTRVLNTDGAHNGEGRTSHHIADGANFLFRTAEEYHDIFPACDWRKVPGATVTQADAPLDVKSLVRTGTTWFVGGVSDGEYGMAVMDLDRDGLTAKKAWFFFDDEYVCLGAGITSPEGRVLRATQDGTVTHPEGPTVATTVDQRLLHGSVRTDRDTESIPAGKHDLDARWVLHDGVGYVFPPGTPLRLETGAKTGRWSDIGSGSDTLQAKDVFTLWIDHGPAVQDGRYRYTVVPEATPRDLENRAIIDRVRVLSNTPQVQAVEHTELDILQAAFHRRGAVTMYRWTIFADQPCLLQLRRVGSGWRIAASSPGNEPRTLIVTLQRVRGEKVVIRFDLPGGPEAGRSVVRDVPG